MGVDLPDFSSADNSLQHFSCTAFRFSYSSLNDLIDVGDSFKEDFFTGTYSDKIPVKYSFSLLF